MATKSTPPVYIEHQGQRNITAKCLQCEWKSEAHAWLPQQQATAHCKETGHSVMVAKEYVYTIHKK